MQGPWCCFCELRALLRWCHDAWFQCHIPSCECRWCSVGCILIISLTLGLISGRLGNLNLRCHCTSTSSNASDIEITIQIWKMSAPSICVFFCDPSYHHSSITHQERSKGELHILICLSGTDESAYNAVNILITAYSSVTMFPHMCFSRHAIFGVRNVPLWITLNTEENYTSSSIWLIEVFVQTHIS